MRKTRRVREREREGQAERGEREREARELQKHRYCERGGDIK